MVHNTRYALNPKKCCLFQASVKYLGYILNDTGTKPQEDKCKTVMNWPRPRTVSQLRGFIGMIGFYRRFIKNMASIARPLYELTHIDKPWQWGVHEENAFKTLKESLCTPPVLLQYPKLDQPWVIRTDASRTGPNSCCRCSWPRGPG